MHGLPKRGRERMDRSRKRVNAALIRQLNVARIFHALRLHPDATQRQLAAHAQLDRATVSTVLASLEERGLVERRAQRRQGRVGRPESLLRIPAGAGALLGARLEPATVRLIVTDLTGRPLHHLQVEGSTDVDGALARLQDGVETLLARLGPGGPEVKGLGVGVPALIDADGYLSFAPNLGWRDVALLPALEARFDLPVYVDNDTKAAGLAEKLFGSCRDARDFVLIAAHSGVGSALHLDGRLYRGRSGFAGELGHVKVRPGGRACSCGASGCLEAYVSERAVVERAAERGIAVTGFEGLGQAADRGDADALALLHETGAWLGEACADLVNLVSPERIVLGGHLAIVGEHLLAPLSEVIADRALSAPAARCEVAVSPLGIEAVTMGGIALAMEGFLGLPGWLAASQIEAALS